MPNQITGLQPPALPLPALAYDRPTADQTNNVLRLYFTRLNQLVSNLLGSVESGGKVFYFPHASYSDTTNQTALATGTEYAFTFNTEDDAANVSLVSNSRITAEYGGVYKFSLFGQASTTGGAGVVTVWAKVNGVNIRTARRVNVTTETPVMLSGVITLQSGDYIEFYWETTNTNVSFDSIAAGANAPLIPSVDASLTYLSNG